MVAIVFKRRGKHHNLPHDQVEQYVQNLFKGVHFEGVFVLFRLQRSRADREIVLVGRPEQNGARLRIRFSVGSTYAVDMRFPNGAQHATVMDLLQRAIDQRLAQRTLSPERLEIGTSKPSKPAQRHFSLKEMSECIEKIKRLAKLEAELEVREREDQPDCVLEADLVRQLDDVRRRRRNRKSERFAIRKELLTIEESLPYGKNVARLINEMRASMNRIRPKK